MWCSSCQQDVPAVATPEDDQVRCLRCHQRVTARRAVPPAADPLRMVSQVAAGPEEPAPTTVELAATERGAPGSGVPDWAFVEQSPIAFDAWRWDRDLHEAEHLLRVYDDPSKRPRGGAVSPVVERAMARPVADSARGASRHSPGIAAAIWSLLALGVMASMFGGGLLAWSAWSAQQHLWTVGLPFAIGGQVALILGLVLQLDILWQRNGVTATALEELDSEIVRLRQLEAAAGPFAARRVVAQSLRD